MIKTGKYYRHRIYHSFIKVENAELKYPAGVGFHKNDNGCVGMGDCNILQPNQYTEITKEEFQQEQKKIEQTILLRLL